MPISARHRLATVLAVALLLMASLPQPARSGQDTATVSFAFWGDPAEAAAYEAVIAAFEAEHPGIDVTAQYTPGKSDYRRRVSTAFAGGQPPDVFLINFREYGQYAASGALEPLGPRLEASDRIAADDFYELPMEAFRFRGGELTCIPQNISSLVVYYNADLFAAAGVPEPADDWTLDDFVAAAVALTVDEDGDGANEVHGLVTESSLIRLAPFVWSMGGEVVDDLDDPTRLTLDTPEARAALEWFIGLGTAGSGVVPDEAEVLAEDDVSRFVNGRAGMLLQSRRAVPTLREIDGFRWDVAPLPRAAAPAGILHSDAFCMAAEAEDPDAAWAFIEYAVGPAGQRVLAETGRTVPSMQAVAESEIFLDSGLPPERAEVYLETIPYLRRVPATATWPEIEDIVDAELQRALYGDVDIDELIRRIEERTAPVFAREAG